MVFFPLSLKQQQNVMYKLTDCEKDSKDKSRGFTKKEKKKKEK